MNYQVFADNPNYRTVMTLSLLLLVVGCRQNDPVDKYVAKTSNIKGFEAELEVTIGKGKPETVNIVREFPGSLYLSARNSRLAFTAKGGVDINDTEKLYDLLPQMDGFFIPPSRGGLNWSMFYLLGLEGPSFRRMFSEKQLKSDGQKDGISFYKFNYKTQEGDASFRFGFTAEGDLKSCAAIDANFKIEYAVKSYTILDSVPTSAFAVEPPDGYVQFGSPREIYGINQGVKFPIDTLIVPPGKTRPALKKPTLFAFVNLEDPKAKETKAWLAERSKSVEVVTVIEGRSDADFSLDHFESLVAGTPTFCLVKPGGIIEGVWMGFSPKIIKTTEKELAEALALVNK